jgi:phospholipase A1/A2
MKTTPMPLGSAILFMTVSLYGNLAQAETPSNCRNIVANAERLACYDQANRLLEPAAIPVSAPSPAIQPTPELATTASLHSIIDTAWGFDPASDRYSLGMYHSNYLLLGRYSDNPNDAPYQVLHANSHVNLDKVESKFQLSLKGRLWTTDDRRWGLWGTYTQNNNWQVYNQDESRPFRETNYMPELIVSYRPDIALGAGFNWKLLNGGFAHQSNGRTNSISRSWNRLWAEVGIEKDNFVIYAKAWYRLPEETDIDENPAIIDYYGHGQLHAVYRWKGHSFTALARGNASTGKGSLQASWYSPPIFGPLRAYIQGFTGYGETMIDYNWRQNTIGAGVALNDGF